MHAMSGIANVFKSGSARHGATPRKPDATATLSVRGSRYGKIADRALFLESWCASARLGETYGVAFLRVARRT